MTAPDPRTQAELLDALRGEGQRVAAYFRALAPDTFFRGTDADWSPAHHLEHLALAHTAIAGGLRAGARLPAHRSGVSRSYAQVRDAYRAALAATPPAFFLANPFAPTIQADSGPHAAVQRYEAAHAHLVAQAGTWSEAELDARAIAHPLLGPLTMREMLLFVLYHDAHHVARVREKSQPSPPA